MDGSPLGVPPPKVDKATFIHVAWGGAVLAALFFVGRLSTRIVKFRRLFWDDLLVFLAWCMFLANTVIWYINKDKLYETIDVGSGALFPPPASFPKAEREYLRGLIAVSILFYSSLWFVKFSFLVFFKPLGSQVVRGQCSLWWSVCIITVLSYFSTFGTIQYSCLMGTRESDEVEFSAVHCNEPGPAKFQRQLLLYNMAVDVITDALIIAIPVNLLWRVRISLRQKLALGGLFSLTVIIMIFAVVRVALVLHWSYVPDESWLYLWSSVEQAISIVVACLASFRILFTKPTPRDRHSAQPEQDSVDTAGFWRGLFRRVRFPVPKLSIRESLSNQGSSLYDSMKRKQGVHRRCTTDSGSSELLVPLESIHVKNEYHTVSAPQDICENADQSVPWTNNGARVWAGDRSIK